MATKVTGRFVIGYDGRDHVIFENAEVVYDHDRVVFVGHGYDGPVDHVRGDARGGRDRRLHQLAGQDTHQQLERSQQPVDQGYGW